MQNNVKVSYTDRQSHSPVVRIRILIGTTVVRIRILIGTTVVRIASANIESGRYARPKLPRDKRTCRFCNEVETETHFILFCKAYNTLRDVLFKEFDIDKSKLCTNNELDTLKLLLNPRNRVQTTQVCKYLSSAIQMREQKNTKAISKTLIKQKNQFCMLIQASVQFLIILSKIQSYAPLSFNACILKLIHVYLKAISKNPIKQKKKKKKK